MGVLYEVLFKPIGRGGGDGSNAADTDHPVLPPDWVLDGGRDGNSPVWRRRYAAGAAGPAAEVTASSDGRRVAFLDAVQVREFERDDYGDDDDDVNDEKGDNDGHCDGHRYGGDDDDGDVDYDSQMCIWTDDWSWDEDAGGSSKTWCSNDDDDYPVLVAVSVTVLGVCIGLAYLFAPVRWLFHQLLVD